MKYWVVGALLGVFFFVITWVVLSQAVLGPGYMIWRVKGEYGFVVQDQALLSRIASRIREAGGIVLTAMWVSDRVDPQAEYEVSIPSKEQPIVPISGCQANTLFGLVSVVRLGVDTTKVGEAWGEDAEKRLNGMTLLCLNHGMTRGNEQVFAAAREAIVSELSGGIVFGVR